jgi:DHA1 family tetracycline resistance protein-like MFS transporter
MGGLALTWYGTAAVGWAAWVGVPLGACWGLFNATSRSIMSKNVGADEQGKLQGANSSILALANIIGPSLFALVFALGIDPAHGLNLPGLALWLAGGFLFVAAAGTLLVTRTRKSAVAECQTQG